MQRTEKGSWTCGTSFPDGGSLVSICTEGACPEVLVLSLQHASTGSDSVVCEIGTHKQIRNDQRVTSCGFQNLQ